jgi:hypothetical protein
MKKNLIKLMNKQGLFKSIHYINRPQHFRSFKVISETIIRYLNKTTI